MSACCGRARTTSGSQGAQRERSRLTAQETQEMWAQSVGQEEPLEEGTATHSSVLAWRLPRTEEPGGLQSMGLQKVGHNCSDSACTHARTTSERRALHDVQQQTALIRAVFLTQKSALCGSPETAGLSTKQVFRDKQAEGLSLFRWEVLLLKLFKPVFFFKPCR